MGEKLRKSGIDAVGEILWGAHICQFYRTKAELTEILIPYFKAGLENNEFCIWIIPESLEVEEVKKALKESVPETDVYLEKGQIEIIPYNCFYVKDGTFESERVLKIWAEKLNHALASGYEGLRLAEDTLWLEEAGWSSFLNYEKEMGSFIIKQRMIVLCPCCLAICDLDEIIDLASNHQFSLIKRKGKWEKIENSGRERAETALRESEERCKAFFKSSIDAVLLTSPDGTVYAANPEAARIFGMSEDELIRAGRSGVVDASDPRLQPALEERARTGRFKGEINFRRKDGTIFPGEISSALFADKNGHVRTIMIIRDITERKKAEEALRESERKYHLLFENMLEGLAYCKMIYDDCGSPVDFIYLDTNSAFESSTGLKRVKGRRATEVIPGIRELHPELFEAYSRVALTGRPERFEIEFKPLGIWLSISVYSTEKKHFVAVFDNITERKKAEDALKRSEMRLRRLYESGLIGLIYFTLGGQITDANNRFLEMVGYTRADLQAGKVNWEQMTPPEYRPLDEYAIGELRSTGVDTPYEKEYIRKDGSHVPIIIGAATTDEERQEGIAFVLDITERKQEEDRIRRYNAILEGINRIFSNIVQAETEEELANTCLSVALEVTGSQIGFVGEIRSDGLLHDIAVNNMGWNQCFRYNKTGHRHLPGSFIPHGLYGRVVDSGKSLLTNDPLSHPDSSGLPHGHPLLTSFLGVPFILEGKIMGILAVANREGGYSCEQQEDLEAIAPAVVQSLERKKIEQERAKVEEALKEAYQILEEKVRERTAELERAYNSLKENERRLSEAQSIAHIGNWEWDIINDKILWSDELYRIFGLKPQEDSVTYDTFLNYVHSDDRAYVENTIKQALNRRGLYSIDFRIILADGEERIVHAQVETIFSEKEIPVRFRGTVQDITEHKQAEEKIKILAKTVESSDDGIITESPDGIITSWNKGAEQVYGYSAEEILGKPISILEPPVLAGETKRLAELVKKGEKIQQYETLRLRKGGKIIYVSITLSSVFDTNGKLTAISVISRDITKRKEAEKALANLEIVRKKEIHHRIKNNLQVISSLLDLQAEKFGNRDCIQDSEVLTAFQEIQDRVISIALIHEELHEGEGTDTLNFSQYLQRLVENLFQTYRFGNPDISLNLDLEENIFFDMDIAVPLGMIVNELVSNSFKHGFPRGKTGEIRIKLSGKEKRRCENGRIEGKTEDCRSNGYILAVSDNGIGIPENFELEKSDTLGIQLVTTLIDQLDGKLELKRNSGTEFVIEFAVAEEP